MPIKTRFRDDKGCLIVDVSYLVHAIAFRSLNIYSKHYSIPSDPKELYEINFGSDSDFLYIFDRNFVSQINKVMKKFNVPKGMVVFAKDCKKRNIWRRQHFSDYKIHRMQTEPAGLNRGPIFEHVDSYLLPKLESRSIGFQLKHDKSEGDDIIAIVKDAIRAREPDRVVAILASDGDLLQLVDDHTFIVTTQDKLVNEKTIGSPKLDLMFKILRGDGSDGIPSCFFKTPGDKLLSRGFGIKAFRKVAEDPGILKEKFLLYPDSLEQYKVNRKIIDFRNIPDDIRQTIEQEFLERYYGG